MLTATSWLRRRQSKFIFGVSVEKVRELGIVTRLQLLCAGGSQAHAMWLASTTLETLPGATRFENLTAITSLPGK